MPANNATNVSVASLLSWTAADATSYDVYFGITPNPPFVANVTVSQYQAALAGDLKARQEEISGVNLDEELSNIIRFQHSYQAAAKIVTVLNELTETILTLLR